MDTLPSSTRIKRNATYMDAYHILTAYFYDDAVEMMEKSIKYGIWVKEGHYARISVILMPFGIRKGYRFRVKIKLRSVTVPF
jgi:hypothetical protein